MSTGLEFPPQDHGVGGKQASQENLTEPPKSKGYRFFSFLSRKAATLGFSRIAKKLQTLIEKTWKVDNVRERTASVTAAPNQSAKRLTQHVVAKLDTPGKQADVVMQELATEAKKEKPLTQKEVYEKYKKDPQNHGNITDELSAKILKDFPSGSWLLRSSSTTKSVTISYKNSAGEIKHAPLTVSLEKFIEEHKLTVTVPRLNIESTKKRFSEPNKSEFMTVQKFIENTQQKYGMQRIELKKHLFEEARPNVSCLKVIKEVFLSQDIDFYIFFNPVEGGGGLLQLPLEAQLYVAEWLFLNPDGLEGNLKVTEFIDSFVSKIKNDSTIMNFCKELAETTDPEIPEDVINFYSMLVDCIENNEPLKVTPLPKAQEYELDITKGVLNIKNLHTTNNKKYLFVLGDNGKIYVRQCKNTKDVNEFINSKNPESFGEIIFDHGKVVGIQTQLHGVPSYTNPTYNFLIRLQKKGIDISKLRVNEITGSDYIKRCRDNQEKLQEDIRNKGEMSRAKVEEELKGKPPGTWLLRYSVSQQWNVLSYVDKENTLVHTFVSDQASLDEKIKEVTTMGNPSSNTEGSTTLVHTFVSDQVSLNGKIKEVNTMDNPSSNTEGSTWKKKWSRAVEKIQKITRGATADSILMTRYNLPEMFDTKHGYSRDLQGSFHGVWEKLPAEQYAGTFEEWIEALYKGVDRNFPGVLDLNKVKEGKPLPLELVGGKWKIKNDWDVLAYVKYLTAEELKRHELKASPDKGFITQEEGQLGSHRHIFVIAPDEKVYVGQYKSGEFHHSSFLQGAPVRAAGEMNFENGKLISITDKSGHYEPSYVAVVNGLRLLKKQGVDLSQVELQLNAHPLAGKDLIKVNALQFLNKAEKELQKLQDINQKPMTVAKQIARGKELSAKRLEALENVAKGLEALDNLAKEDDTTTQK